MPTIQKLTVLGGGSTYTPELLSGFIEYQDEIVAEQVSLYDIHSERLEVVGGLAKRMFRRYGLNTQVELTESLEEAVSGADFVVSQIRVGWMQARLLDERIPLNRGVLGQELSLIHI